MLALSNLLFLVLLLLLSSCDSTTETRIIIDNLAFPSGNQDTLVGFNDLVIYSCFSDFSFYSNETLLSSQIIDGIDSDCLDNTDICIKFSTHAVSSMHAIIKNAFLIFYEITVKSFDV